MDIYVCIIEHQYFHVPILYSDKGTVKAIVCPECNWILQDGYDGWELKQTFIK